MYVESQLCTVMAIVALLTRRNRTMSNPVSSGSYA